MKNAKGECKGDGDENDVERERILNQGVADQVKSILSTVVTSGTAVRARLDQFAAGKTGTTENYGDAWFVGFTDDLTVAVWVGYPDKLTPMTTEYAGQPVAGGTYPADIWRDFMIAATNLLEERKAKEGGDEEEVEEDGITTTPLPAGTPTTPGSAEPAEAEPPAPTGGDPRPEQPDRPDSQGTPPVRQPQPEPEPAPATPPAGGGGGGGGGGAEETGGASPPSG